MILKRSAYFIIFFSVLLLTSLLEKSEYSQKANSLRPNIIFYLADDQDRLDYGSYGNPNVETSNVDLLVKQGIKFENFYTGQAICAPSRSQIRLIHIILKTISVDPLIPLWRIL